MKKLILLTLLLCATEGFAAQSLRVDSVGFGAILHVDGLIQLPKGQKLNSAAPSKMAIYEKVGKDWVLTENVNLNEYFALAEVIPFRRPVRLKSESSELKVEASLYHCPKAGKGICVIDDFEGKIARSQKKVSSEVKVTLVGSQPK